MVNVPQIPDAKKLHVDRGIVCAKHCDILKNTKFVTGPFKSECLLFWLVYNVCVCVCSNSSSYVQIWIFVANSSKCKTLAKDRTNL